MPATSTLTAILQQLVEETGLGFVIPSYTGTTTTITLTDSYLKGPFSGAKFPVGSAIIVTSTTGLGDKTYVSNYVPSTGVITVSPAITTGSTDAVLIVPDIDHPDRVIEAINRVVKNRIGRWQLTPLTFVPDGDLRGATVTDYWTAAANGTASYQTAQTFPAGSAADEAGATRLSRVLQLVSSGGGTSVAGNGIRLVHTAFQRTWYFLTAIRLVSGTGTVTFSVFDNTNSEDITPFVKSGNDALALTTNTFSDFMICEGTLFQPATCDEIAPKLTLSATGMTAQMAPVIMFPLDAMSFPLPNRITSGASIGNFHQAFSLQGPGSLSTAAMSPPVTTDGRTHHLDGYGDHLTVTFNFRPTYPLYYDEFVREGAPSLLTDTVTAPLDQVVKWAKFELFKYLYEREKPPRGAPSLWKTRAAESRIEASGSLYEPELLTVVGRV